MPTDHPKYAIHIKLTKFIKPAMGIILEFLWDVAIIAVSDYTQKIKKLYRVWEMVNPTAMPDTAVAAVWSGRNNPQLQTVFYLKKGKKI